MKKKLLALLNKKTEARQALVTKGDTCEDVTELRGINSDILALDGEIEELRSMIDALPDEIEGRGAPQTPQGGLNPLATYGMNQTTTRNEEDVYSSLEYRQAFKNYIVNGTPIPESFRSEQRADALTQVADVGAVIPTTIMNRVIEDMTVEGKILNRVTQTAYQGGIAIPISEVNPVATWLADESTPSDEQKAAMEAKVTFSYHVLEAKVAIGLLSATVSLPIFENTVVKQLKKSMIRAIETSIISGTGTGQPLGLTKHTLPAKQVISMAPDTIGTVSKWAEAEAAIPEASEDSVIYLMNKATWEKYLNGMVDKNGQKIGLGRINEKGQKIINGREVLVTDKLPAFDAAATDDIFGVVVDLSQYLLNSNLSMFYKKYYNEDKNKWVHKALMIADGKMAIGTDSKSKLVGAEGLIYLKKAVSAGV